MTPMPSDGLLWLVFWSGVVTIAYTLVGFPLVLAWRARWMPRPVRCGDETPTLSVIVAAHNEERVIGNRVRNLLASDYPRECLEIIVVSDGSTDRTAEAVQASDLPCVKVLAAPRGGKGKALDIGVAAASADVLVFTDANTTFARHTLRALVRPLHDPTVGGVAGRQVYTRDQGGGLTAEGERCYWGYDSWLKRLQSESGSVTSATGAVYAIRAPLYQPVPPETIDDFYISTGVVAAGRRLVLAADALAFEPPASRARDEFRRKVRIGAQGLRAVVARRALLNPLRHGFYAIQMLTHKLLRRLLVLVVLGMTVAAAGLLRAGVVYQVFLAAEGVVLASAAAAWLLRWTHWGRSRLLTLPFYACSAQVAMLLAVLGTACGMRVRQWEPERHGGAALRSV